MIEEKNFVKPKFTFIELSQEMVVSQCLQNNIQVLFMLMHFLNFQNNIQVLLMLMHFVNLTNGTSYVVGSP